MVSGGVCLCWGITLGVAVIVGVHGIAQQYGGGLSLTSVWFNAVRDGLIAAGYRVKAEALKPGALRVAFFGDLFRPAGVMAAQDPPYTAADVALGLERELLTELYGAAVAQDPLLGPPDGAMGRGRVAIQVMLERLLRSATFAGVAQRAFIGNLKQVSALLTDPVVREQVLARVGAEVGDDTRVLIGHSLGSVAVYEYLCRYRPPSVRMLVTLGSPLGIPNLIFERLTPAPVGAQGAWPGLVTSWLNVADPDDIVALRKQLAGLFPPPSAEGSVRDQLVDNGERPHAIDRYLNAAPTGAGLGDIL